MELCKLLHTFATHDFVIYSDAPSAHEVTQCNIKKIILVHDTIRDSMFFHLMHQLCILYLVPPVIHSAQSALGLNIMWTRPLKQMRTERLAKAKRRSCRQGMSFLRAAPNDWRQLAIT